MDSQTSGSQITAYSCPDCGSVVLGEGQQECCSDGMEPIDIDAVKEPDLMVLLPHVFGVSQSGVDVCVTLMEEGEMSVKRLATALDVNQSTVTRQLNQLQDLGVVDYREESLSEGGRIRLYSPVPLSEVRQRHREGLFSWVTDALTVVDEIDSRKLEAVADNGRDESVLEHSADE